MTEGAPLCYRRRKKEKTGKQSHVCVSVVAFRGGGGRRRHNIRRRTANAMQGPLTSCQKEVPVVHYRGRDSPKFPNHVFI